MLVVDLLHEFKLGIWKAVLTHLIRILDAKKGNSIQILTRGKSLCISLTHGLNPYYRFRDIPTFGRGTIRCFANNVSDMKKLAGRDFEDILQVGPIVMTFIRCNHLISIISKVHYPSL